MSVIQICDNERGPHIKRAGNFISLKFSEHFELNRTLIDYDQRSTRFQFKITKFSWSMVTKEPHHLPYEKRLERLDFDRPLNKTRERDDFIYIYKIVHGIEKVISKPR